MTGQAPTALDRDDLLSLYHFMRLTRAIEDRTRAMYTEGKIIGGVYTGAGMEATSVGAAYALRPGDVASPLHRDLGAHLVRGTTPREVFCQWLARGNSPTRGRDSRLHVGDMRQRMIVPASGIIGATLPVVVGTALAAQVRGQPRVSLAFIGDGGTNTGDFHEALNLAAALWVPLVVIIENNGYAYSTPTSVHTRLDSLARRAAAYGIPGSSVDGNDVLAVYEAAHAAIEHARAGGGPALIEARTFRMSGHSEADSAEYVPVDTLIEWAQRDPITQYEARLVAAGVLDDETKQAILAHIAAAVEDAVRFAEASAPPDPTTLAIHVYTDDGTGGIKPRRLPVPAAAAAMPTTPAHVTATTLETAAAPTSVDVLSALASVPDSAELAGASRASGPPLALAADASAANGFNGVHGADGLNGLNGLNDANGDGARYGASVHEVAGHE